MLMKNIARILLAAIVAVIIVSPLAAAEPAHQRYIVVIRRQRFGPPPTPDVLRLGGTIESQQDDQLVVTIPAGALAALKSDPAVLYLERVGGTPTFDDSPLIGEPADPQPGTQSKRLVPHALGTISWNSGNYTYDGAGNIVSIGTDNYLYDGAQRLRQSSTQGTAETYTYDGFGNMKTKTNTTIPTIQASTNRYDGYTYNEVGAVRTDGSYEFTYDALGQPLSKKYNNDVTTQEYYIYTANDERIGVERNNWWIWSVRDEGGKVLRQYNSSATNASDPALWLEDFVWRDGLLLGSQRPVEMGGRRHFHLDHLGTPRLITSDSGQMVSYHDYYPFGDEHSTVLQESASGFGREEPMKFTDHERDYAGGMGAQDGHAVDYMHARYYNASTGRFLSVDPNLEVEKTLKVPQKWNRYAYALNNPIRYTDPDGKAENDFRCVECPNATAKAAFDRGVSQGMKVGAAIGAAYLVGRFAPSAASALFTWALGNPNQAMQVIATALSPPGPGSPFAMGSFTSGQALEQGLVRSGGKLAAVIGAIEQGAANAKPGSANAAMEVVQQAVTSQGLEPGLAIKATGGSAITLQNVGNVTTQIFDTGRIVVKQGEKVVLDLIQKAQ
jgi:RHS repeat-associated protein